MIPVPSSTYNSSQSEISPAFLSANKPNSPKESKTSVPETCGKICFSPLSEIASQTGLNINESSRYFNSNTLFFNFRFDDTLIQSIHAKGFWELHSQKMEMNLSFEVNESILYEGQQTNRQLKFHLHFSVENIQYQQANINETKEKLPDFLLRIAKTIAEYASSKDKEISALILDAEDARDLFQIENGKLMKDIIAAITIIYFTNKLLDRDKEDVALYIPRKKETLLNVYTIKYTKIQFSAKVEEIISDSSTGNNIKETHPKNCPKNFSDLSLKELESDSTQSAEIPVHAKTSHKI